MRFFLFLEIFVMSTCEPTVPSVDFLLSKTQLIWYFKSLSVNITVEKQLEEVKFLFLQSLYLQWNELFL